MHNYPAVISIYSRFAITKL